MSIKSSVKKRVPSRWASDRQTTVFHKSHVRLTWGKSRWPKLIGRALTDNQVLFRVHMTRERNFIWSLTSNQDVAQHIRETTVKLLWWVERQHSLCAAASSRVEKNTGSSTDCSCGTPQLTERSGQLCDPHLVPEIDDDDDEDDDCYCCSAAIVILLRLLVFHCSNYPRRARSASAWILFSLWMYVCMFVCMLPL